MSLLMANIISISTDEIMTGNIFFLKVYRLGIQINLQSSFREEFHGSII